MAGELRGSLRISRQANSFAYWCEARAQNAVSVQANLCTAKVKRQSRGRSQNGRKSPASTRVGRRSNCAVGSSFAEPVFMRFSVIFRAGLMKYPG